MGSQKGNVKVWRKIGCRQTVWRDWLLRLDSNQQPSG